MHTGTPYTCYWFLLAVTLCLPSLSLQAAECGPVRSHLIELYTSEGCSSCPPAEHWLNNFRNDPGLWDQIVPVAFHVDYWNYLGWVDTFASKAHSGRQRQHARFGNTSAVYTPGVLLGGKEWRGLFGGRRSLPDNSETPGILRLELTKQYLQVHFSPQQETQGSAELINTAWLGHDIVTQVHKGENAGKELRHEFVVLEHNEDQFTQHTETRFALPTHIDYQSIAVWLTDARRRVIQACGLFVPQA